LLVRSHTFSYFNKNRYVYLKQIHQTSEQRKLHFYGSPITYLSPVKFHNFHTAIFDLTVIICHEGNVDIVQDVYLCIILP
jgi:hypothetical protein